MALSSNQFAELVKKADVQGRKLHVNQRSIGCSRTMFVNFSNIPADNHCGADFENNRVMFKIEGFDSQNQDAPAERVRIEVSVSFDRMDFRARHMKPESAAKLLVATVEKIVQEKAPRILNLKV